MNIPKCKLVKIILPILCFSLLVPSRLFSQLAVTANQTAAVLSSTIGGPGISISAPVLTCAGQANGTFNVSPGTILGTGTTVFGIGNGIILTTGKAVSAAGAEPTLASTNNGTAGDPALATLALTTTLFDACILEFDFTAVGNSISFNYIFGSEEYNHSTCGPYNDAFAFFISGPGITGTQDMALVPGTNIPVTVNSVNSGVPGPGYTLANCTAMGPGSPFPAYFTDNTGGANFTYKGFTTVLAATHTVTPCSTYHLKMSITDAGNSIYDSGVFIEAGSLSTPTIVPGAVCVGGTTTFTSPLAGGTWSSSNTAVATIAAATGVATGVSVGTATISYTIATSCFLTTTVTVNALAPILGVTTVCAGNTTSLSDPAGGGTWSTSNAAVATVVSTTGVVTGVSGGTATITYLTAAGCSAATTVTVNSVAAIAGATTICIGATTALSDVSAGGVWSSSSTGIATVSGAGVVTGISGGVATITYTIAGGCFATIPVNINTSLSTTVNAGICQGSSYTFAGTTYTTTGTYSHTFTTATCDSSVTLHLSVNPVSNTDVYDSICNGTTYIFDGTVYTNSGIYTYHTINVYGCDSAVTLHLFVKPSPPAPTVVSPVVYCQGHEPVAPLIATGTGIMWYTTIGGAGSNIPITPSDAVAGTTLYYVGEIVDGCAGPLATIQVIVNPSPVAVINAIRTTVCQFDTTSLFAGMMPSGIYSWFAPGTAIISSTNNNQDVVMQFNTLGNHRITLTVSENGQCSATDSITINVVPAPVSAFYVKPDVCLGDTVVVAVSSTTSGVTNCIWNFEDATIVTATDQVSGGPYGVTWSTTGIHYIHMSAEIGQCLSKEVIDTVDVHPLPDAQFTDLSSGNVCAGDSALLSAVAKDPNNLYQWTPAHFFNNTNSSEIYGVIERAGYVILDVTSPFGCKGEDSLMINAQACCEMLFPNAFTPNGDGKNDIFLPITNGHHKLHTFMIVNRWGQTVFETVDERNGWNGLFNGVQQDMGVYFYYIKYDCNGKTLEQKGEVNLIR